MIEYIAETGSTNVDLLTRLTSGELVAEGDWLVADRQIAGRGRQGRQWFDGLGNFMGSTAVLPGLHDPPAPTLALVAGLAVYEALVPLCPDPRALMLKWPNDVMLGGAKLCGILLEARGAAVIVGIGVNLATTPQLPDRPTVAMADVTVAPARDDFARRLARSFATELERWRNFGLEPLLRRWMAAGTPKGAPLVAFEPDGTQCRGRFAGLDSAGNLLLALEDGEVRAIHAGDIMLDQSAEK